MPSNLFHYLMKTTMKKTICFQFLPALLCCVCATFFSSLQAQIIAPPKYPRVQGLENVTAGRGSGFNRSPFLPYPYSFKNPIYSDMLCDSINQTGEGCTINLGSTPEERYLTSVFGPRMKVKSGAVDQAYDYHLGADIVDKTDSNVPDIKCMCAGEVVQIVRITNPADNSGQRIWKHCAGNITTTAISNIETTEEGQFVKVKCNADYEILGNMDYGKIGSGEWGNIFIAYRHLSSIDNAISVGNTISKGATVGKMGSSGITTFNHLHLSAQIRESPNKEFYNAHPMRLFNPEKNRHVIRLLDNSEIEIYFLNIHSWRTDGHLLFRFAVPYYQANLQMIRLKSGTEKWEFDFEKRGIVTEDDPDAKDSNSFDDMELFVFPFNRAESAYSYYSRYKTAISALTPEHSGKKYPLPSTGVFTKSAYVIDIKAKEGNINTISTQGIEIEVYDIWGKGVKAVLAPGQI